MRIEFFYKETGNVIKDDSEFFVMGGKVMKNNFWDTESQEATVDFYNFVEDVDNADWRVVGDVQ